MAKLQEEVFGDPQMAQEYQVAAGRVREAISTSLFNEETGLYRVAKFGNETYQEADLATWYSGTVNLAWPHLFGVFTGDSDISKNQLAAINANWDWTNKITDPNGGPWTSMGQAALLANDRVGAARQAALTLEQFPDFQYPFTVGDGGFLITTLSQLREGAP